MAEEESMRPFTVAGEKTALRLFNLPFSITLVFVPSLSWHTIVSPLFAPFIYKMHHFTKTGSGQT